MEFTFGKLQEIATQQLFLSRKDNSQNLCGFYVQISFGA